jgi:parvulin-like peptidyl-prolyl isomerase
MRRTRSDRVSLSSRLAGSRSLPRWLRSVFSLPCLHAATFLAAAGCGSERLSVAGQAPLGQEVLARMDPTPPIISRSQKPDTTTVSATRPHALLDLCSADFVGPNNCQVAARIRATVNGSAILDDEVREAIYPYLMATQSLPEPERSAKRKEFFDKALDQLVEREVILQDALSRLKDRPAIMEKLEEAANKEFEKRMKKMRDTSNIKNDEEFKAALKAQGMTIDGVKRQVKRNFMAMEYMRNILIPKIDRIGHEQIDAYYRSHPEEFRVADSVTWQDLFVDASRFASREAAYQFAEQIRAQAQAGHDFQQMVMKYDQGDSSYRNGEGFGHRPGEIKPPEAEPILFQMRDGDIGPIVEQSNGFHVLRLVKREYAGLKPFDQKTQRAIREKLQGEAWEREYKRVVADLRRNASIEISSTSTP